MPNLYFCQPQAKNHGILRAVLSPEECAKVVDQHAVTYLGEQFPNFSEGKSEPEDFAILSVAAHETFADWRPGFYRFSSRLIEVDEALRKLQR